MQEVHGMKVWTKKNRIYAEVIVDEAVAAKVKAARDDLGQNADVKYKRDGTLRVEAQLCCRKSKPSEQRQALRARLTDVIQAAEAEIAGQKVFEEGSFLGHPI